jgi:predicted Rossmann fold nucleotide-binding protein DprA/Smf involved in DNA uptake
VLEVFGLTQPEPPTPTLSTAGESVLHRLRDGPASADELVRTARLGAAEVAAALTELELHGLLTEAAGLYRASARS